MTNRDKFLLKLIDMPDRELANIYCLYINDCHDCRFVGVKKGVLINLLSG